MKRRYGKVRERRKAGRTEGMEEWMARDGTMGHDTEKGRMGSDRKKKEVEKE